MNVQVIFSQDWRTLVNRLSRSVEHATQHVLRHGCTQNVASELADCILGVNARCSLEDLDDGFRSAHLQHLTRTDGAIGQAQLHDLGELGELHLVQDDQRTVDTRYGFVGCGRIELS